VIQELVGEKADFQRVYIGYLPFGTGNDFAIACGWGAGLPGLIVRDPAKGILERIEVWLDADRNLMDIWDTEIITHDDGFIRKVNVKDGKVTEDVLEEDGSSEKKLFFKRKMSNYCSVGIDARIGFGFDKNRSTIRCCND
jgi:diacylglycerol kinase (ATP)